MRLATFTKQPSEDKDYDVDYSPWLDPMEDTLDDIPIPVITCLTDPDDTSLECYDHGHTTHVAKFWVRGGTAGYRYKLTIQATTVIGRLDESELIFKIKEY